MLLLYVGGPLVSLAVGGMCLWLLLFENALLPTTPFSGPLEQTLAMRPGLHTLLDFGLASLGLWNLCFGVSSLLPAPMQMANDAAFLLGMIWRGGASERQLRLHILNCTMVGGARPRDWDSGQVGRLLAMRGDTLDDAPVNLFAYYHALDCGSVERAGAFLDLALAQRADYSPILVEAAYFEAFHRRNLDKAKSHLRQLKPSTVEEHTRLRAEAAVLMAAGHYRKAAHRVELGLYGSQRSVDQGGVLAERDWLEAILNECQEKEAEAASGQERLESVVCTDVNPLSPPCESEEEQTHRPDEKQE